MLWSHLQPLLQLVAPVGVAAYLLHLQLVGWRGSVELAAWVAEFRATLAIFVQVVAAIVGMLQVQAICKNTE